MSIDLSQIGLEAGLVSVIVTFAGKFLFVTKSELALSAADQKAALDKHVEEDRKERTAEYRRLFDKMDAMVAPSRRSKPSTDAPSTSASAPTSATWCRTPQASTGAVTEDIETGFVTVFSDGRTAA